MSFATTMGYVYGVSTNGRVAQDTQYSATEIVAAPASGSICITDIDICNGGTARVYQLLDGATVIWQVGLAASTSSCVSLKIPLKVTAKTALTCTSAGASTGAFVGVNYFIA